VHLKNQPPVFVPHEHRAELEKLSKAALMDIVWDYAQTCAMSDVANVAATLANFRERRDIVLIYRKHSKEST
jgi:hypothetical protein